MAIPLLFYQSVQDKYKPQDRTTSEVPTSRHNEKSILNKRTVIH